MGGGDYARALTEFWTAQGKAMLDAQDSAMRAMTEGMQAMMAGHLPGMPGVEAGAAGTEFSRASESVMQLWTAASSLFGELSAKLGQGAGAGGSGEGRDGVAASVFSRLADPRQWMSGSGDIEEALTRMAQAPRLADLFDLERRYARVMQAWVGVRRRTLEHQAVVLDAWLRAGRRYNEEASGEAGGGKPIEPKRALALWTEIANRVLLETQRSEPFLASQREMIRASTELRMAQQDLVERFGAQYGFPTRTELDDVHRSLTEMRRELRRTRRLLQQAQEAQAARAQAGGPTLLPHAAPAPVMGGPSRAGPPGSAPGARINKRKVKTS